MATIFPYEIPRAIRRIHDIKVRLGGQKAILYRYLGDDVDIQLPDTEEVYDTADLADLDQAQNDVYSDPIETHIVVEWPEGTPQTNQDLLDVTERNEESSTFPVTIKFEDYVTRKSYFKTGTKLVSYDNVGAGVGTSNAEKDVITRLQINEIESQHYDNQYGRVGEASLMTDDNKLADSDTSKTADNAGTYLFS